MPHLQIVLNKVRLAECGASPPLYLEGADAQSGGRENDGRASKPPRQKVRTRRAFRELTPFA